jgi:hypothetical protein
MDEQLALRLGALRLARRRGRLREAAWAAARLRLAGVTLAVGEARFARDTRIRFGRALRSARVRAGRPVTAAVVMPLTREQPKRADRRRLIAAALAAVLLIGSLLLYVRISEPEGAPEGAQPVTTPVSVVTPPPLLKGRSQPGAAAPVAIVEQTPSPTDAPPSTPAPGTGTGVAGPGTGAGGSGNGTGVGSGRGTPAPTPKPTPTPTPTPTPPPAPTPTIDPQTLMHVQGRVVDSVTRQGIAGVCVAYGTTTCLGAVLTDSTGFYEVDLSIGRVLNWGLTYIANGYQRTTVNIRGRPGVVTQNIFLRKSQ